MTNEEEKILIEVLKKQIKELAIGAASWCVDGNSKREDVERMLKGMEDGDPRVYDNLPSLDWSMQWADGPDWSEEFKYAYWKATGKEYDEDDEDLSEWSDELFVEIGLDYSNEETNLECERLFRQFLEG